MKRKVISNLRWAYSLAELNYQGKHCFLVGPENNDPCELFTEDGEKIRNVWEGPGGTMTMQELPGKPGSFLATHRFYSPNEADEASIVLADLLEDGSFAVRKLCDAPFVHRFGILSRNNVDYLLVCCLKSGQDHVDDWMYPGAVYSAVLPRDLSSFDEAHQLKLNCIRAGMLRNHGFCLYPGNPDKALVTCDTGVYEFIPPEDPHGEWTIRCLLEEAVSDAVLCDFDEDGLEELAVISPFHGDRLAVYHQNETGTFTSGAPVWEYPKSLNFLHAIWAGDLQGKKTLVIGHRRDAMDTLLIRYEKGDYNAELLDPGAGAANAMKFVNRKGQDVLVCADRENSQVVMYTF